MPQTPRLSSIPFALTALTVAIGLPGVSAQAAPSRATAMMVCTGTSLQRYSPALGPLPRPTVVSLSERLTCTGGPFATGAADAAFANPASCLVPPVTGTVPPADVLTYRWSNGQTSTITYTLTTVARAANQNIVTSAGTVPFGYAQGSVAQREVIMPNLDVLGCLASNISQQSGSETLSILL